MISTSYDGSHKAGTTTILCLDKKQFKQCTKSSLIKIYSMSCKLDISKAWVIHTKLSSSTANAIVKALFRSITVKDLVRHGKFTARNMHKKLQPSLCQNKSNLCDLSSVLQSKISCYRGNFRFNPGSSEVSRAGYVRHNRLAHIKKKKNTCRPIHLLENGITIRRRARHTDHDGVALQGKSVQRSGGFFAPKSVSNCQSCSRTNKSKIFIRTIKIHLSNQLILLHKTCIIIRSTHARMTGLWYYKPNKGPVHRI